MNKKAERGRATREHLVDVATRLFAEHGYEDTSIEAVLRECEISRGALYHHFNGKEALFEAVFQAVETAVSEEMAAASAGLTDPVEALREGCLTWIRLAGDPVVQRIVLIDAPSVLGWQRWREIEDQHSLGLAKAVLRRAAQDGRLPRELADPFAHMLLVSLNEIATIIARSDDPETAMREGRAAVEEYLRRLLP